MKQFFLILGLGVLLLMFVGCATCDKCPGDCKCTSKDAKCCGTCSDKDAKCCGTCSDKDAKCCGKCGDKDAADCKDCTAKMKDGTGWCPCGKGFYKGKEVNCKGECKANPGGPPCPNCVK